MKPKVKILVVRFSSIGDIVLTTPVIRCLKEQLNGEVELHYLTKKGYGGILKDNPHIYKVHTIEEKVSEVMEELKEEEFHYVVDLHKNIRSAILKKGLQVLSFSFDKINFPKWLMVNFKINRLPDKHIVDRYLESVSSLGVENDRKGLDYFIPKEDEVDPDSLPKAFHGPYITFAIGAQHATKRLPVKMIMSIIDKMDLPVILIGGKEDAERGEEINRLTKNEVFNSCGAYNINGSASLIKQSELLITHDTGAMHIGAAFRKKIISIWGNTIPEFGMYPYLPSREEDYFIAEVKGLGCRPCTKIGFDKCPKGHFKCMKDIDVGEIGKVASGYLNA